MNGPMERSRRARLLEIIEKCRGREVWIVGDLMLDEYLHGVVQRISPEAPVPVVQASELKYRLGGAANVAKQVVALGGRAVLGGVIGDDAAGRRLLAECTSIGVDTRGICQDSSRRTTRKLRVLGHGQQLVRLDWEDAAPCRPSTIAELLQRIRLGPTPDAVILSDYAKGVLTDEAIATFTRLGRDIGCPVLVDPKRTNFTAYRGATLLTPNLGELSRAVRQQLDPDDHQTIAKATRPLIETAELDGMIVTLSERGMLYVGSDSTINHIPAVPRAVADVTGAGDTAMAVLATTLSANASIEEAMTIANTAAGLAVAEIGAVAIGPDQISMALGDMSGGKLVERQTLAARAAAWRAEGKRIVFTNGCFDLLHAGHLSLLHTAAGLGDVLVLAINSDASVRRLKGPERPFVPEHDRATLLAGLSCVDAVTIFDEDTPLETLRAVRPHVLAKGQDYRPAQVVGRELVEADGGRVSLVPLLESCSTSALIERVRSGAR